MPAHPGWRADRAWTEEGRWQPASARAPQGPASQAWPARQGLGSNRAKQGSLWTRFWRESGHPMGPQPLCPQGQLWPSKAGPSPLPNYRWGKEPRPQAIPRPTKEGDGLQASGLRAADSRKACWTQRNE